MSQHLIHGYVSLCELSPFDHSSGTHCAGCWFKNWHMQELAQHPYWVWCTLPIVIHDGVESVSDSDDRAVVKGRSDGGLDQRIRFHVNGCCGLVQHQDCGLPQQRPGQAHQLPLTHAATTTNLSKGILHILLTSLYGQIISTSEIASSLF